MPSIELETIIHADLETVFDLARSIDLHKVSMATSNEEAIAGKTSGLIELGESVTWRAKHFGVYQTLTSRITAMTRPDFFMDVQEQGIFRYFEHRHFFESVPEGTRMLDLFEYTSPLRILGKLADVLIVKRYMTRLLSSRNAVIKKVAEKKE